MFWRRNKNKSMGEYGEDLAVKYLKKNGYKILERNFANTSGRRLGEIDVVAKKGKEIIFVEVKTRELERYSDTLPEENITPRKLHKLSKIANNYIKLNNFIDIPYRFDAISVWVSNDYKVNKIKHIESIFI